MSDTGISFTLAEIETARQEILEEQLIELAEGIIEEEYDDDEIGLQDCELRAQAKIRLKIPSFRDIVLKMHYKNHQPGTYDCHEAMDRTSKLEGQVAKLLEKESIVADPEWYALAHRAHNALYNLYQAIGDKHLEAIPDNIIEQIESKKR